MNKTDDEDDTMDLNLSNDTMNLLDMEQDTMDLNIHEQEQSASPPPPVDHHIENATAEETDDEEEEEDELLDINELNEVMQGLMQHYDSQDDMNNLREMLNEAKHTRHCIQQAQREPKQNIRDLTRENDDLRDNCANAEPAEAVKTRMDKLHRDKISVETELTRMKLAEENCLHEIQDLEKRQKESNKESNKVQSVAEVDIPRVKYALSLYGNISNIVWDYGSENVKGMITSTDGSPTKMFNIDATNTSSYEITNKIWDLID